MSDFYVAIIGAATVFLFLAVAAAVFGWYARNQRDEAMKSQAEARQASKEALDASRLSAARLATLEGQPAAARHLLVDIVDDENIGWLILAHQLLRDPVPTKIVPAPPFRMMSAAFSIDGRKLVTGAIDGTVRKSPSSFVTERGST